ncbi:MAG: hypothetical protein S4CHLAM45_04840 [Chlamydiales bacterium]|nr:hypothetical protein [Chlamydiales bacterium]MCH9619975.1 hypothetical protein [Chlamydiales bacterium]MCH9622598.1 hypothetical protein [Chlamydiales bacterium]
MLQFLRKHQKIFFLLTTIVVIFSFTFYGAYSAFTPSQSKGKDYRELFHQFLKYEGAGKDFASTNFLNDFVVTGEFIDAGLAPLIFEKDPEVFRADLENCAKRERAFSPYVHPFAKQLSAEMVWSIFAPELKEKLELVKGAEDPCNVENFQARVDLFMAERRFPAQVLANMLRMQERDMKMGVGSDPKLMRGDVSVFGYTNLEDWFGPTFIEKVADVLIETAHIAKKKGYKVSRAEVMSDLLYRSQKTYDAMKEQVRLPVSDGAGLLQLFMQQSGFDETNLVKIWETITLYKRLIHDVGNGALVDTLPLEEFYQYAGESIVVEVTQMPTPLRFNSREDLRQFELYLAAKNSQELQGKRYSLYVGELKKECLAAKVSVQETWNWEEKHLPLLEERFSQLKEKSLDELSQKQRAPIDAYARQQIVNTHPEWIEEGIKTVEMKEKELFFSHVSTKELLKGVSNNRALQMALDEKEELVGYTQDEEHFYRILVRERSEEYTLTFAETRKEGLIHELETKFSIDIDPIIDRLAALHGVSKEEAISYRFFDDVQGKSDEAQFKPTTKELTLTRTSPSFIPFEVASVQEEGRGGAPGEGAYHYRVVDRKFDTSLPIDKMLKAQQLLSKEVQFQFMRDILCSTNSSH